MINEKKKIVINIGKEVLVYVPGKLLPALFGFIGVSVYTRILSPTEYGD